MENQPRDSVIAIVLPAYHLPMSLYFQLTTLVTGIVTLVLTHGICAGQDSRTQSTLAGGLDIGLITLSDSATQIPRFPLRNMSYDPLKPAESGQLVLYVVNNNDASRSLDTSSVRIRAIGSEHHELELGGDLFGVAKRIEIHAGESRIVFRTPWKNVLDAETLRRNRESEKPIMLGAGSEDFKITALHWGWKARPTGPDSPIYQVRGELAAAATLWAELSDQGRTVRSQPLLLFINKLPR